MITDTEEAKAAVEYWDRVVATSKLPAAEKTVEPNLNRAEETQARKRAAEVSRK